MAVNRMAQVLGAMNPLAEPGETQYGNNFSRDLIGKRYAAPNSYSGDEGYQRWNNSYLAEKNGEGSLLSRFKANAPRTYQSNQQHYGNEDIAGLIGGLNNQMTTGQSFGSKARSDGADGGEQGGDLSWQIAGKDGAQVRWMGNGQYQILRKPPGGHEKTPADIYDASGKYLGTNFIDTRESGLGKAITGLTKAATIAMVGGGIAGGFGAGPMASGGAPAGATGAGAAGGAGAGTAGAGGIGAAAGDAGLMYAGADAAAAGYLGAAPATLGGSVGGTAAMGAGAASGAGGAGGGVVPPNPAISGAGGAGSGSGGGFMDLIKSGGGGMFDWGDVIGLGKDLIGGYMNDRAADKATDAQMAAVERAIQLNEPWRYRGEQSLNKLADVLGFNGRNRASKALMVDPGYHFRVQQGEKQIERQAASRGRLLSGSTGKALVKYGQEMGSQEYGNTVNRLMALAGYGQNAAGQNANYATQGGNAQAAGTIASANAWSGALNNAWENYQQNEMLRNLMKRSPV